MEAASASRPLDRPLENVAVVGGGLALWLSVLSLDRALPDGVALHAVETRDARADDVLYGTLLPPETYALHLELGITEPDFLRSTRSGFAYGAAFVDWADTGRSWVEAFHAPLPVVAGVPLAKLVAGRTGETLESCLVSALAAERGAFAHPPEDAANPLSRAEYGYLADPSELAGLYRARTSGRVRHHRSLAPDAERDGDHVRALRLADGTRLAADLFVDATGPEAALIGAATPASPPFSVELAGASGGTLGIPATLVESDYDGWRTTTQLRGATLQLSVGADRGARSFRETERDAAWRGNVAAVGQAAGVLSPLTVAPMRLLQRDVKRLRDLIPVTTDTRVEARAFSEAARDDGEHARHYHLAHFAGMALPDGAFWNAMRERTDADALPPKLSRRLVQYGARAHHVGYDHEPFDAGDWAILHAGLGRRPERADPLAAAAPPAEVGARLAALRTGAASVAARMPQHADYMHKLLDYLDRRSGTRG